MRNIVIIITYLFFVNCNKNIAYFVPINPVNSGTLTGVYYCESTGTWICGKCYGIVEFSNEFDAEIKMFYECKGTYFTLFTERIPFKKMYRDHIIYRGANSDIVYKGNELYLFVNTSLKVELFGLTKKPKSDSLYAYIKKNEIKGTHLE